MPYYKFRLLIFVCIFQTVICSAQTATQTPQTVFLNQPIEKSLVQSETQKFALHLESCKFGVLVLEQKGVDLTLAVDDAKTGKLLFETNAYDSLYGNERVFLASDSDARDLLIRVFSSNNDRAGKFSLTLTELKNTDDRDKLRFTAQTELLEAQKLYGENKAESKQKGFALLASAAKSARQSGDVILEKDVLFFLQSVSYHLGDFLKTIEYGQQALTLLNGRKLTYDLSFIKTINGFSLINMNETRRGIDVLSESAREMGAFGDLSMQAVSLAYISEGYQKLGDLDKSLAFAEQSYQAAKAAGHKSYQANALRSVSRIYFIRSDFAKSIEVLNQALTLAKEVDENSKQLVHYDLALSLISLGQLQKALDYLQESLLYYRNVSGDKWGEAATLQLISSVYSSLGQNSRSLEYNRQATEIYEKFGYKSGLIGLARTQAANYRKLGDYEKEKQAYLLLLKITEKDGPPEVTAEAYLKLGIIEKERGNYDAALDYYAKSRQVSDRAGIKMMWTIAGSGLSDAYILAGQYDKAAEIAEEVRRAAHTTGDRVTESNALYDLARIRRHSENLTEALSFIEDSLKIAESLRATLTSRESRASYFSTIRKKYDFYIELLNELENREPVKTYGAQAFAASERFRARGLLDLLAESYTDVSGNIGAELKSREQSNAAKISALQKQLIALKSASKLNETRIAEVQREIDKADDERERLESEIRRTNPRYASLKYPATLDLAQTQKMLDEKSILLEYQTGADASFLFAVGKNEFQIVKLPNEKTLRESVELLRRSISSPARAGLAGYLVNGRALYRTLLAPIEKTLKTKNKIIVSADGALNYLPFEVLLKNDAAVGFDKLPYLVRDYEISYTPSASVLANLNGAENFSVTAKPSKSFLAFAAPDYGAPAARQFPTASAVTRSVFGENRGWKLTDLPNAKTEAERIARLFPADESTVFSGGEATEERAKTSELLSRYRYLHFAVHGLIDEEQPQFSSLVLSLPKTINEAEIQNSKISANPTFAIREPKPEEDGLLQTPEIFNLRLRADLVTLSACETGLGKEMRGEGIVGLTRAFFYAGTSSVLVSLWKVNDASTTDLMTFFYESLRKTDGREKAAALRAAQLKMIDGNRYAHPYFWAPFVLQGKSDAAKLLK